VALAHALAAHASLLLAEQLHGQMGRQAVCVWMFPIRWEQVPGPERSSPQLWLACSMGHKCVARGAVAISIT
jgi:hypothetical protein